MKCRPSSNNSMKAEAGKYLHPISGQECQFTRLVLKDGAIEVGWTDGHESLFHHVWLRDSCYCAHCGDSYSSKRYFLPSDMPACLDVNDAAIDESGDLLITWSPDGHRSQFDAAWLRQHCYDDAARDTRMPRPVLWNSVLETAIPRFVFENVLEDASDRMTLYRSLRDYGVALVSVADATPGYISELAPLVGDLGSDSAYDAIFDLTPSSPVRTMGNTQRSVPPHTDEAFRHSPPGLNILGCIRPAKSGGETILVDGFLVGEMLRKEDPEGFRLLSSLPHTYHRRHDGRIDQVTRAQVFSLDEEERIAGVRIHTRASAPLDLPSNLVPDYYRAYRRLCEMLVERSNQMHYGLEAGEAVIFDNHRVLHARGEFSDPERFLQICNVSRDDFQEKMRLLALNLGHVEEASRHFDRGAST